MADCASESYSLGRSWRKKFEFNLRIQRQIRDSEQAHAVIADIDAHGVEAAGFREYADRSIEQLALSATPFRFEIASQKHE